MLLESRRHDPAIAPQMIGWGARPQAERRAALRIMDACHWGQELLHRCIEELSDESVFFKKDFGHRWSMPLRSTRYGGL